MATKVKDPRICTTPIGRVSFPSVYEPSSYKGSKPKFSCRLLFTQDTDMSPIRKAVHAAKVKEWGPDKAKWPKKIEPVILDGNEKADVDGYADHYYVTAKNKNRPRVVKMVGGKLEDITEESGEFFAGCMARMHIRVYAQSKPKAGVYCSLEFVKKVGEGKPFSGGLSADEAFADDEDGDYEDGTDSDSSDEDEEGEGGF